MLWTPMLAGIVAANPQASASPPTIRSTPALSYFETAAASYNLTTSGVGWTTGDFVLALWGSTATVSLSSIAGDTNDTYAGGGNELQTGARLSWRVGTVVSGALDGTTVFTQSGSRRAACGVIAFGGASGIDVAGSGQGNDTSPICPSIVTTVPQCRVLAVCLIRDRHTGFAVPSGYTVVGSLLIGTGAGTANHCFGVAQIVQASAGTVAAATWQGITVGNVWCCAHIAIGPS